MLKLPYKIRIEGVCVGAIILQEFRYADQLRAWPEESPSTLVTGDVRAYAGHVHRENKNDIPAHVYLLPGESLSGLDPIPQELRETAVGRMLTSRTILRYTSEIAAWSSHGQSV